MSINAPSYKTLSQYLVSRKDSPLLPLKRGMGDGGGKFYRINFRLDAYMYWEPARIYMGIPFTRILYENGHVFFLYRYNLQVKLWEMPGMFAFMFFFKPFIPLQVNSALLIYLLINIIRYNS